MIWRINNETFYNDDSPKRYEFEFELGALCSCSVLKCVSFFFFNFFISFSTKTVDTNLLTFWDLWAPFDAIVLKRLTDWIKWEKNWNSETYDRRPKKMKTKKNVKRLNMNIQYSHSHSYTKKSEWVYGWEVWSVEYEVRISFVRFQNLNKNLNEISVQFGQVRNWLWSGLDSGIGYMLNSII